MSEDREVDKQSITHQRGVYTPEEVCIPKQKKKKKGQ